MKILTIGQIAYVESQKYFIEQLANDDNISIHFAGSGPAVPALMKYVQDNCIHNIEFSGRYEKNNEQKIVEASDIINIWLKNDINADSCMANRFYLSALLMKPMIVNNGTYMARLCEEYCLGLVIKEGDNFKEKISSWYANFDFKKFSDNCRFFLNAVKQDMNEFEKRLLKLYC